MDHLDSLRNLLSAIEHSIAIKRQGEGARPGSVAAYNPFTQSQLGDDMVDDVLNYCARASLTDLEALRLRVCRSGLGGLDAVLGQMSGG